MEEPAAPTVASTKKKKAVSPALSLLTFRANRVIFDEAHHLRNKASRVFKGAMRLVVRRPSVWCVTGTPIQNKISDLKSLCYVLGFRMCDVMSEEKRKQIRNEYVLRRTKVSVGMVVEGAAAAADAADVTCAPRLQSLEHYKSNVPWSSENELDLSREIHRSARNTTDRAERLKLYTRMRQMCVWPSLLRGAAGGDTADTADDARHGLSLDEYRVAVSKQSKMDRVVATMAAEAAAGAAAGVGRKSIVFCHYRREMTQLRDMLLRSVVGDGDVAIIDGTVSAKERARILTTEPTVLILQIRTCSEGLNLQSYSDVYFVSPHWNPCVEDQAIARCYRMGQTSQVRVFRFYMSDFVGGVDAGAGAGGATGGGVDSGAGGVDAECISTLDHKCEEIQERKRVLCNEFLCGV
jgi:SNF2 family DNA or RNA helicase